MKTKNRNMGSKIDDIILAMREPYLSKLLSGEKTIEVRKTHPKTDCLMKYGTQHMFGMTLYLYHRRQIWGHVTVTDYVFTENADLDRLCEKYAADACLSFEEMFEYLYPSKPTSAWYQKARQGVLYFVEKPVRYEQPVPVPCRPQSWQYMTAEIQNLLPKGKE